jgi:hypothetical protein
MEIDQDYQPEKVSQSRMVTETAPEPRQTKRVQSQAASTGLTMREQPMAGVVGGPGQMGGVELEMEDWEVAPGRVKDESSESKSTFVPSTRSANMMCRRCVLQLVPD